MKKFFIIILSIFMLSSIGNFGKELEAKRSQRWFIYNGNIGPYSILFFINPNRSKITGKYLYKKYGKVMKLVGTQKRNGKFIINEINPITGKIDAVFSGKIKSAKKVKGWWKHKNGRKYRFTLDLIRKRVPSLVNKVNNFLIGEKLFSMQWISWENYGLANFVHIGKGVYLYGNQKDFRSGNYVRLQGVITKIEKNLFEFKGVIDTYVNYNDKRTCTRKGKMTFKRSKGKNYYRLQNMQSPCSSVTDYIDIFTN